MQLSLDALLAAVRKASLPGVWSLGFMLARDGAVALAGSGEGELTLRVRSPGLVVAPTVTLYMNAAENTWEWSCDCDGKVDPCMHVAAAIIASAQAAEKGQPLANAPASAKPARLVYRLGRRDRLLTVTRLIVHGDDREERLQQSLASDRARGQMAALLTPTHEDMRIDRILGSPPREGLLATRVPDVFEALSAGAEVTFDGAPVQISGERVVPRATVGDAPGGGFRLRLERAPEVTEVVARGVVRCGNVMRPLGEMETTGELLERLPLERTFARSDTADLVTKVLPELEAKLDVVIATTRLPRKAMDVRPRIAMDLSHQGHTLSVLPTLVYGDPAVARVDGAEIVPLGDTVPLRRHGDERELLRRLRDELHLVPGRRVDLDGSEAIRFATRLREWQKKMGDDGAGSAFEKKPLRPRLVTGGDEFDIVFESALDGDADGDEKATPRRAEAAAVIRAWRDGLDLVPLQDGGWAPLPADWLTKHGHLVADLLAARGADKRLTTAALPTAGALCDVLDAPRPPELARLAPLFQGFEGIPAAPLPEGLQATLRTYQKQGVDWLSFLRDAKLGGILADDMGLGKTLQTLCVLRGRTLVVCPKSVVYNWADEIARFRPGMRAVIYHGPKRELDPTAEITLTTYALLRLDAQRLAQEDWDAVVLDEAQAIKNLGSQTARAAFELHGKFRIALSGTPVENRLEELWSAMHFANPGLLGGASDFQERYSGPIESGDPDAASRLRSKIRPFILRRTKAEVVPELPSRTDTVLHVELDDTERSIYDAVRAATKQDVAERLAHGGGVLAALEALLRLRQAACHPSLLPSLVPGPRAESSSKVERLLEALEESVAEGHKALVFSQWTSLLDLVEPALAKAGIAFTRLDGSTVDRGAVVNEFQDDRGPPVMLVSLKAGGTGLNLTAADHVFLLDPWWNPAVEDQAASRAHRIGQERPVMVYRMVAKDTVEERILTLQDKKRRIADVALGDADQAGGITRAELLALLE
jgi:superfamily II DNA or RNA helicase